jgi:hypothetical protein
MTAQAQHTGTAGKQTRRADAGVLQITQRDINGFVLCAEHQGLPFDLLASALRTSQSAVKLLVYRWRRAGYVATARLGPGPWWCWLTKEGMSATGLRYPTGRPPLSRLAHIRAVMAARLWLSSGPVWQQGQAWWQSERRLRAGRPRNAVGHVPDAEIHWPSIEGSPYAGQVWAIEVELTPKTLPRTTGIMTEMLAGTGYASVVYLTSPAANRVVTSAAARLGAADQARLAVRGLPEYAFVPEPAR